MVAIDLNWSKFTCDVVADIRGYCVGWGATWNPKFLLIIWTNKDLKREWTLWSRFDSKWWAYMHWRAPPAQTTTSNTRYRRYTHPPRRSPMPLWCWCRHLKQYRRPHSLRTDVGHPWPTTMPTSAVSCRIQNFQCTLAVTVSSRCETDVVATYRSIDVDTRHDATRDALNDALVGAFCGRCSNFYRVVNTTIWNSTNSSETS